MKNDRVDKALSVAMGLIVAVMLGLGIAILTTLVRG